MANRPVSTLPCVSVGEMLLKKNLSRLRRLPVVWRRYFRREEQNCIKASVMSGYAKMIPVSSSFNPQP
jgi:hypothetical protein